MALLSNATQAAKTALTYITLGALTDVWAGVWYVYMKNQSPDSIDHSHWYICTGLLLTGLALLAIGFTVGHIGRAASRAEVIAPSAAPIDPQLAAANPAIAPPAPGAPGPPGSANQIGAVMTPNQLAAQR